MELLDIVNENDEVVGVINRKDPGASALPKRIVHIFVFDSDGKMLLQKRSMSVRFKPGAWATAACGHVHSGEDYDQGAHRELEEELGFDSDFDFLAKDKYDYNDGAAFRFIQSYRIVHNGPFTVDPEEVDRVEFFTPDEIKKMIAEGNDFHPETLFLLKRHFSF